MNALQKLIGVRLPDSTTQSLNRLVASAALVALLSGCGNSVGYTGGLGDDDDDGGTPTPVISGACADPETFAAWRDYAEAQLAANAVPGGAIAIVCDGQLAFAEGLGVTKKGGTDPVDADTRFQLASVTKGLAAAAAVSLEEDGLLSIAAPVSAHVTSSVWGSVPLEKFLSHTSGFSTNFDVEQATLEAAVSSNANQPLWAPPGAVFNYSNVGYSIAGHVVAKAAGKPFADVIQERVFTPAGMTRATMSVSAVMSGGNYAWGTEGGSAISPNNGYYTGDWYGPMGGAWSSVTDLGRWAEAHFAGTSTISLAGFENLATPRTPSTWGGKYGLGLEVIESTPRIVTHSGSTLGYQSDWLIVPERGFAIVVLINANDGYYPQTLTWDAIDRYIPDLVFPAASQPGTIDECVGTYQSLALGSVEIVDDGGALAARFGGGSPQELFPSNGDSWYVTHPTHGEIDLTFWRPNGGQAEYIVSLWGVGRRQ